MSEKKHEIGGGSQDDSSTFVNWADEPVASPQATMTGHLHEHLSTHVGLPDTCPTCIKIRAAQPVAGTTPQAERLGTCERTPGILHEKNMHGTHSNYCVNWEANAVAPVETLGKCEFSAIPHTKNGGRHGHCKWWTLISTQIAVETRLTAEQFWPEWAEQKFGKYPDRAAPPDWAIAFVEAFRDKSEVELRERYNQLLNVILGLKDDNAGYVFENKGLREEIERLDKENEVFRQLNEQLNQGIRELRAALRERCETFVEHTCTGSALCKECRKALSAAPKKET